ncbi:hypothetical protein BJ508DRAFT_302983 [Ascobolus immersus RN42]|uniref:Uncharacterized protein n=1 Tax=Ascobolus immersus RN42 TaxID=1160509 RepID=A0A3N4II62_ASCIM|nr:hypothetical protein BJ508DRAFT_302983 [Ascobolus immersus RN42]
MSPSVSTRSTRSRPLEESASISLESVRSRAGLRRSASKKVLKSGEVKKVAPPGYRVNHFNEIICDKENVPFHPSQIRDRPVIDENDYYELGSDGKKKKTKPLLNRKKTASRVPLRQLSNEEVFIRDEATIGDRRRRVSGDHFAVEIDSSLAAPSPGTRAVMDSVSHMETISVVNSPSISVSSRVRVYHSRKVKEQAKEKTPLQRKTLQLKTVEREALQVSKDLQPSKKTLQPSKVPQPSKALQPKAANSKNAVKVLRTPGSTKKPLKERRAVSPTLEYSGVVKKEASTVVRRKATVTKKTLSTAITIYVDQENIQPQPVGKKVTEKRVINTSTTIKKTVVPKPSLALRRAVGGVSRKPLR